MRTRPACKKGRGLECGAAGSVRAAPRQLPHLIAAALLLGSGAVSRPAQGGPTQAQEATPDRPSRSAWDGVYTEEQARRGRSLFRTHCADCHKPEEFRSGYRTANDLFSSRSDMPQNSPDSLEPQKYADLIAFVFEANGMPPGQEELKGDPEVLKRIRIDEKKPPSQ